MQTKKLVYYFGVVFVGLLIYGGIMALWSVNKPWEEFVWNNEAIKTNATIVMNEVGEVSINGDLSYVGYIIIDYDDDWAELLVVDSNPSQAVVERLLEESYAVNNTVVVYYNPKRSFDPHLGPKPIIKFIVWILFGILLFISLTAAIIIIIYRDYVVYKLIHSDDETSKLYNPDEIRTERYNYSK